MALFSPKKPIKPSVTTPIDAVMQMKQQGFSNSQIVQTLQREGFKSHQIFDALNQVETSAAGPVQGAVPPPPQPEMTGAPIPPQPAIQQEYGYQQEYPAPESMGREKIEEIAESIIEEKWTEFMKSVNKILEWKESIENKFIKIEHEIKTLKTDYDKLHKGVLGRISEYDKSITDVGVEVKALGKTFEKILPTLTENVSELSRITSRVKKKK
ncbi:MAG: hypothetical protein U9R08_01245 [Nanoarchaeota archaeon]|nr:hypothetical protein [Nanoarchaeota archaeon]